MNRVKAGGAMIAVMVAAAVPAVLADAKGRVNVKGASFTVADAVAYKDGDDIEVALLPAAFNRKDAVKDRKIDSFDVMRMDGGHVTLIVKPDGSFNCINYSTGQGGGSSCTGDYETALKLTTRTATRVAGTSRSWTRGSVGFGALASVTLRGSTNCTTKPPPAAGLCVTGAVMLIFTGMAVCVTGAVISIFRSPSFLPKM